MGKISLLLVAILVIVCLGTQPLDKAEICLYRDKGIVWDIIDLQVPDSDINVMNPERPTTYVKFNV